MVKFILVFQSIVLLTMPFLAFADHDRDHTISQITLQIRYFQDRLSVLLAELATKSGAESIAPAVVAPELKNPSLYLFVNGSDGSITIPFGSSVFLSWKLSDHSWSYCTKLGSWSGGVKTRPGSEVITHLTYGQTYTLYCYIDGTRYSDSVVVNVAPEIKKVEAKPEPTSGIATVSPCNLSVSKPSVTIGKDAIEAIWVIKSDPPGWPFYWHGTDNGKEVAHYYGGVTNVIITTSYNNTPAVYTRYFEVVQGTGFVAEDPNHPTPTCISNTATFEIKAFSSREATKQLLANSLGAIVNFFKWLGR